MLALLTCYVDDCFKGSSTIPSLCEQQLHQLKHLQDEQYLCLNRLEYYENKLQTMTDAVRSQAVCCVYGFHFFHCS